VAATACPGNRVGEGQSGSPGPSPRRGSGKYSSASTGPVDTAHAELVGAPTESDYVVIDALNAVAEELGASPAAVALSWVQGRPAITSTLVGARRMDQFKVNLAALDVALTDA
jgi:aryl-alcohol dehydrogenase-like predicted oxidoreductase